MRCKFNPWIGKIPWRRERLRTPVFLPEKSHGQRSLAGYSPRGHKESDTTAHTHMQLAYEYECGPISSDNWTFTGLLLRTSNSLSKPSSPCRCFRNALGSLYVCSSSSLLWPLLLLLFVFMGESSAQPMVTIPLLGTFPWAMVIPRWYHCFTDAPERPRVPLESKLLWLWYVAVVWRWGWKWDELFPACFILLEVLSYSSIFPDSFLFIPSPFLAQSVKKTSWI